MAFRSPSATNTFIPSYETQYALVSATRDPTQFKLARYIQYVKADERVFYYLKLDLDEPARLVTQQEFLWAPGQAAPTEPNIGAFQFVQSSTLKYGFGWIQPNESIDQAEWDLESSQMGIVSQKAMTNRTTSVATIAQTPSNWPTTNTSTVNSLNGGSGKWTTASSDPANVNFLAIKKSITAAYTAIVLQTNAAIRVKDMNLIVSPTLSQLCGNTSEIYYFTKGSPDAFSRQEGVEEKFFGEFGMPPRYSNVNWVVEDSVRVTSRPNVTTGLATSGTRAWVWADASPVIMSRKGGIDGKYGGNSLSTIQLYHYRNMETYTKSDTDNERMMGRIVDDFGVVLPFGQSGYLLQQAS